MQHPIAIQSEENKSMDAFHSRNNRSDKSIFDALTRICLPLIAFAFLISMSLSFGAEESLAIGNRQGFAVNQLLSDGKNGRVWRQWRQNIANRGVQRVEIVLRRQTGGNNTSINLRYGDGQAFEGGRQIFFTDNNLKTVSFNVGGAAPNGQPLVINAYNGEVFVTTVNVYYQGSGSSIKNTHQHPPRPKPRPGNVIPSVNNNNDSLALQRCRNIRIRRPRIEVGSVRASGGLFSNKKRIKGSIFGACVEEAGYFENGRLKQEFPFPLSDRYQRRDFEVQARTGRNAEIRVFTVDGREDSIDIDDLARDGN
jgi:hypothetical protein